MTKPHIITQKPPAVFSDKNLRKDIQAHAVKNAGVFYSMGIWKTNLL